MELFGERRIKTRRRSRMLCLRCLITLLYLSGVPGQREGLRQKRQQPSNMPQITGLDVQCEKSGMTVNLEFSAPFNGVVFSKGHFSNPACRYVRKKSAALRLKLMIPLSGCGTQTMETSSERLMIENTLIIQIDPMVQDTWDSARKITCDWQSKLEKMVTFAPFSVSELMQVAEVKFAGSGDNVRTRMEIQFGRGPFAVQLEGLTKIGDELTVVIYADDGGTGYDMMIKNCYAYDSRNFKSASTNKIRLLNDHGCLFRPNLMEYFKRTTDSRSTGANIIAFARMNAFKFPDKMDVFLSCELELCKGGCDTHCEMDDYPIDIIPSLGRILQPNEKIQQTEPVITTFRPAGNVNIRGLKRRRKPKKFGRKRIDDDAAKLLTPPVTLSPEIIELLEELGVDNSRDADGLVAQARQTENPFKGNNVKLRSNAPTPHATAQMNVQRIVTPKQTSNKMSFSTIFAGTHTTSNQVPAQVINNQQKFKPSQLLSASLGSNTGPFTDSIQSMSKGNTGLGLTPHGAQFPARQPVAAAHRSAAPHNAKLTNVLEQKNSATDPFFKPAKSEKNVVVLQPSIEKAVSLKFSQPIASQLDPMRPIQQHQDLAFKGNIHNNNNNNFAFNANANRLNSFNSDINTLQQHLKTEGQFVCTPGSTDPRCNPNSNQILGGFLPISTTTPNAISSTVIFTPPRPAEALRNHFIKKKKPLKKQQQILVKIVERPKKVGPPPRGKAPRAIIRDGTRPRFGTRLAHNTQRLVNFLGARKKRDAPGDGVRNVFQDHSQTVNMVKGFQVVSASDLAFDPGSLAIPRLNANVDDWLEAEEDICFPETTFYASLLTVFSILMISGLVSVCSIRKVRKYQQKHTKRILFGEDPNGDRDIYH